MNPGLIRPAPAKADSCPPSCLAAALTRAIGGPQFGPRRRARLCRQRADFARASFPLCALAQCAGGGHGASKRRACVGQLFARTTVRFLARGSVIGMLRFGVDPSRGSSCRVDAQVPAGRREPGSTPRHAEQNRHLSDRDVRRHHHATVLGAVARASARLFAHCPRLSAYRQADAHARFSPALWPKIRDRP